MKLLSNKYLNQMLRDIIKIGSTVAVTYVTDNGYVQFASGILLAASIVSGYVDKFNNQAPVPSNAILSPSK